jgi:hypothetical protein
MLSIDKIQEYNVEEDDEKRKNLVTKNYVLVALIVLYAHFLICIICYPQARDRKMSRTVVRLVLLIEQSLAAYVNAPASKIKTDQLSRVTGGRQHSERVPLFSRWSCLYPEVFGYIP